MTKKSSPLQFKELYEKYFPGIYRFIYNKTWHRETAEDICSTVFMKIVEKLPDFRGNDSKLTSWIFTIARNQITDYYRKMTHHRSCEDLWDLDTGEDPEVDVINKENFEYLHNTLKKLKTRERDIIMLHLWEEYTFKEIALSLKIPEGRCKVTYYRALEKIRKNMSSFMSVFIFLKPMAV